MFSTNKRGVDPDADFVLFSRQVHNRYLALSLAGGAAGVRGGILGPTDAGGPGSQTPRLIQGNSDICLRLGPRCLMVYLRQDSAQKFLYRYSFNVPIPSVTVRLKKRLGE